MPITIDYYSKGFDLPKEIEGDLDIRGNSDISAECKTAVSEVIQRVASGVEARLGKLDVRIVVFHIKNDDSDGFHASGYAPASNLTLLHLYPDKNGFQDKLWKLAVSSPLTHELHHNKRWVEPGFGETLGEHLVTEGLAQAFQEEMGYITPPYALTFKNADELAVASDLAKNDIMAKKYDEWFYGNGESENSSGYIKPWTGYSLGYALVKAWFEYNEKKNLPYRCASEAVAVKAEKIISLWMSRKLDACRPFRPDEKSALNIMRSPVLI